MDHEALKDKALKCIEELFGDTSVEPEKTIDSLKELREEIDMKIEAIEDMS